MTTTVTKESLAARIADLEYGPRSLKEDYTLAAYKMLLAAMDSEQNYRAPAALFGVTAPDLTPLDGEPRTVTVKLPDLRQIVSGDRYVWSDGVFNYSQDVKAALTAAGIKWEAE